MKKQLLKQNQNFYKVNLHAHTTLSDGNLTPQELKDFYKSKGYHAVAFTDHEIMFDQSALTDETFIALKGYETATSEYIPQTPFKFLKTGHFNFIAKSPDIKYQVCFNKELDWLHTDEQKEAVNSLFSEHKREHTAGSFNYVVEKANENGFLSFYNHPAWSLHNYNDYIGLKGLSGIEVFNGGCVAAGFLENDAPYQHLLENGVKLNCLCTDDNHNAVKTANGYKDSCLGYVMIGAAKLTYANLIEGLSNGNFYSSTGAKISAVTLDGRELEVCGKDFTEVTVFSRGRNILNFTKEGAAFDKAAFTLPDDYGEFFRVKVKNLSGQLAYTNAYYEMF